MSGRVVCSVCSAENPAGQRFCGNCGSPLPLPCGTCGAANPSTNRFCGTCGTALATGTAAAVGAASTTSPIPQSRDERRLVTVLFADVSGFTAMSEQMDHEEVKNLADRCAELMGDEVARFGGRVLSVMGDAVMAVFGAPVAHEDDPERAVRAALAMIASIGEASAGALSLHAGVNTGEVLAGLLGPAQRRDYTVMGDTVNTAARLMSAAHGGQVMVGRSTFEATERTIRYETREPYAAKGKRELVEVWEAMAPLPRRLARVAPVTALVGRDAEMDQLRAAWGRILRGPRTEAFTILGAPGLGKTRLAREFGAGVEQLGHRVLWGASAAYGDVSPYAALAEQVRQAAGIDAAMAKPEAREALAAHVIAVLGAGQDDVATNLQLILGFQEDDLAPDREGLFLAVRRYLAGLARQVPTVLVFEDLHWADPTLVDLAASLAARLGEVPLMILALARPELLETNPRWSTGPASHTVLALEPLDGPAARELAVALLGDQVDGAADRLAEAAGGNPLFLEELAASVTSDGATVHELPTTVRAIIGARIDTLPDAERTLLQAAATVGDVFWRGALAAVAGLPGGVDRGIDELEARGFVRRSPDSRLPGEAEFVFKHALIREVAYGRTTRAARREQHAAIARFLEESLGDRAQEEAPLLAHHLVDAGQAARAVEYLSIAADRASRAWAKAEAVALYSQAIDLLGDDPGHSGRRAELQFARGKARGGIGDLDAADADLGEALEVLTGDDRALALLERSRLAFNRLDADDVVAYARLAQEASVQLRRPLYEAQALVAAAQADLMAGELEKAITTTTRGVDLWPTAERATAAFAEAISGLSLFHYWHGDFERAMVVAQETVDRGLEERALQASVMGMAHVALGLCGVGRHPEALPWFERSVALGREWEAVPRFASRSLAMWGGAAAELMDFESARRMANEALELGRSAAFGPSMRSSEIDLALLDLGAGEVGAAEAALPVISDAAAVIKGFHSRLFELRLAYLRSTLALAQERYEDAATEARAVIATADRLGRRKYQAWGRTTLARALTLGGKPDAALEPARDGLARAARIGHPHTLWRAARAASEAAVAGGDDESAREAAGIAADALLNFTSGLPAADAERVTASEEGRSVLAAAGRGLDDMARSQR